MAFNGSGTYILPDTSLSPTASAGTTIVSADFNTLTNDLATALTKCIAKDGQSTPTADLPMGGNKHTGVDDGAALTDYSSVNQVVDNTLSYCATPSAVGTDAYVVSLPVNPVAYAAGNRFQFIPEVANTGACTVDFNAIGVKNIKLANGDDPIDNAIQADVPCDVMYDGTSFILINPFPTYLDAAAGTLVSSTLLLAPGSETEVLTITSGVPAWEASGSASFATSSHAFGSVAGDTDSTTWDWTHGLGTDDVDFGFSVLGATNSASTIGVGRDVGGYQVSMVGGSATDDAGVGGNPSAPASGELAFRVKNTFGGAQAITIKVWARVR